jgi:flagellar protein FlaF
MPEMLKKNILSLSVLFDKQAFEVMSDPAPQKLTLLININLNIAAGLRGNR